MSELTISRSSPTGIRHGYLARKTAVGVSEKDAETNALSVRTATDSLEGVKNPHWRSQVSNFQQAATPLTAGRTIVVRPLRFDQHVEVRYIWPQYDYDSDLETRDHWSTGWQSDPTDLATIIDDSDADNLALSNAHIKINQAFAQLQAGVIVGESRETIKMISDRSGKIYTGLQEYLSGVKKRSKLFKRKADALAYMADSWLEYSFGWRPFANDISDAIDYVNETRPERITIGATNDKYFPAQKRTNIATGWSITHQIDIRWIDSVSVRYIAGVEAADSRLGRKFENLGLAPKNFLPTIVELIPWSFLVAYFVNLDGVVAAISNFSANVRWGVKTTKYSRKLTSFPKQINAKVDDTTVSYRYSTSKKQNGLTLQSCVVREPIDKLAVPGLVFSLPGSLYQGANIVALGLAHDSVRKSISKL